MVHAKVLPRLAGAGSMVAAVAQLHPGSIRPWGASSSRMPETSTPALWPLQLQGC